MHLVAFGESRNMQIYLNKSCLSCTSGSVKEMNYELVKYELTKLEILKYLFTDFWYLIRDLGRPGMTPRVTAH